MDFSFSDAPSFGQEDYEHRKRYVQSMFNGIRLWAANYLSESFNHQLKNRAQNTVEEKHDLCRFVNRELREFGLAVCCPKSGLPATIRYCSSGRKGGGLFGYECVFENGNSKSIRSYSKLLQKVDLVVDSEDRMHFRMRKSLDNSSKEPYR